MASRIEEIRELLKTAEASQETADLMVELAALLRSNDVSQALALAGKAAKMSGELGYRPGVAAGLRTMGVCYEQLSDYTRALQCGQDALAISEELGDAEGIKRVLNSIGLALFRLDRYGQALEYYQRTMGRLGPDDKQLSAFVTNNIGLIYRSLGDERRALDSFQKSLAMLGELNDLKNQANALSNMGTCYRRLGEYPRAIECLEQSLVLRQQTGDRYATTHSWNNLGTVYFETEDYPRAHQSWMKALDLSVQYNDVATKVFIMINLGRLMIKSGQAEPGIEWLDQALPLAEQLGDRQALLVLHENYATTLADRGDHAKAWEHYVHYYRTELDLLEDVVTVYRQEQASGSGISRTRLDRLIGRIDDLKASLVKLAASPAPGAATADRAALQDVGQKLDTIRGQLDQDRTGLRSEG